MQMKGLRYLYPPALQAHETGATSDAIKALAGIQNN